MSELITMTEAARRRGKSLSATSHYVTRNGIPKVHLERRGRQGQVCMVDWEDFQDPVPKELISLQDAAELMGIPHSTLVYRAEVLGVERVRVPRMGTRLYLRRVDCPKLSCPLGNHWKFPDQDGQRFCSKCQTLKPVEDFYRHSEGPLYRACKPCHLEITRAWARRHPEKVREQNRRAGRKYYEKQRAALSQ